MNTSPRDEFAERVMEITSDVESTGKSVYYDPDGDCIEFLSRPEEFWAERIDDLVTVYYSERNN